MSTLQAAIILDDYSSGMIDESIVSDSLMPRNAVRKAVNCVFDNPKGAIRGRLGSSLVGSTLGSQIRGLYNFRDSGAGTDHRLLTTDNAGTTYYLNGGVFTSTLTGDTAALKTRFVTFLDLVARLNGTDGAKAWSGTGAWSTTGTALDLANWPSGTKFAEVFTSRVYTAGNASAPDTLYYSSLPSAGSISWTSGNGSLQVNPNDGDGGITAIKTNGTVLMIFKRFSMYRWDGSSTFANKVIGVGTPSYESVSAHDSGWVYFFGTGKNGCGIYRTSGGYPQDISRPIRRWLDAISANSYENVAGYADFDHYYVSVGSVTVDGATYSNAWFVYTISQQCWHIENRAHSFAVFSTFIDSSNNITFLGGDTSGNVHKIGDGTVDLTAPISAECELAPLVISSRARTKSLPRITAYSSVPVGIKLLMGLDNKNYKEIGEIDKTEKNFTGFYNFNSLFRAKRFFPKISISSTTSAWQFDGLEINEVNDEGYKQ